MGTVGLTCCTEKKSAAHKTSLPCFHPLSTHSVQCSHVNLAASHILRLSACTAIFLSFDGTLEKDWETNHVYFWYGDRKPVQFNNMGLLQMLTSQVPILPEVFRNLKDFYLWWAQRPKCREKERESLSERQESFSYIQPFAFLVSPYFNRGMLAPARGWILEHLSPNLFYNISGVRQYVEKCDQFK